MRRRRVAFVNDLSCSLLRLLRKSRPDLCPAEGQEQAPPCRAPRIHLNLTAMKPPSGGGPNMKIKQQLPPLIRGNSRQAGVTKAEQEKPLTANHCIDPQARPLATSRSTAPRPPPPLPTDLHVYCGSSAFMRAHAHTCTDKKQHLHIHPRGLSGPVVDLPVTFPSADSATWIVRFCPFALSPGTRHPPTPPDPHTPQWRST